MQRHLVPSLLVVAVLATGAGCRDSGQSPPAASASADGHPKPITTSENCAIVVERSIGSQVYRGVRSTEARRDARARLDVATRRKHEARDHSIRHLQCTYLVSINGAHYHYEHVAAQSYTGSVPEKWTHLCHEAATAEQAAASIRQATRACTNLSAGEYWGQRLRLVEQAGR